MSGPTANSDAVGDLIARLCRAGYRVTFEPKRFMEPYIDVFVERVYYPCPPQRIPPVEYVQREQYSVLVGGTYIFHCDARMTPPNALERACNLLAPQPT